MPAAPRRRFGIVDVRDVADLHLRVMAAPAAELSGDLGRILRTVAAVGAGMVQPIVGTIPPAGVRSALDEAGVGVVYGGIEISHDDDPGWVFSRYADTPGLHAALFRADVLPEYRDSWVFLRDKAPEFEEEFQVGDLDGLARERPLLVGLDFTPGNVAEILAALPGVRGIALTLGGQARRGDVRFHPYDVALAVVRAAAPRGGGRSF
ncbi:hypothetical protein [Actinoplanes sp. NPDC049316]|uniref:hypothetical protein n=1 Tax=Actinoplanes sp. NPDC049316 TaxID=3154727 RepID=UPI00341E06FB